MGVLGTAVQCYWKPKTWPKPVQVAFNVASMASATAGTYYLFHSRVSQFVADNQLLILVASGATFFVLNTVPVACVISLTEQKPLRKVWSECYFWSFPYYLLGAAIAGIVELIDKKASWQPSLLILPVVYLIFRSYRLYLARLEAERNHAEGMAALHLRTIEALALAIEAKDHGTHEHLRRVQVYAMSIGKEMGLSTDETEALRAAAVLHDIGKLAVPEHIISKPGRLTPEEFDKMKIHPIVGAEILEQVRFPYPVAPIVRSHHEKWDGSGYPDGLSGDAIPIDARILAAVDCLDALASDRQYRRALPLDEAMAEVEREAGKSFDPSVVAALKAGYIELEQMTHEQQPEQRPKLSTDVKVERGAAPAAGFAQTDSTATGANGDARKASPSSRARRLAGITSDLASAHNLEETLALFSVRLRLAIAFDAIAFYAIADDVLTPQFVSGEQRRALLSLRIPRGEGLSGWVAETHKCIMNGNPAVEPGFEHEPGKLPALSSALAVALESDNGMLGVITLYRSQPDALTSAHLRLLQAVSVHVA